MAQESGQYVKVANESLDNGGIVVQSTNYAGNSPRMYFTPSNGNSYTVKFTNSGKCLDIAGPTSDAGGKIHQWDCHGGASQDWQLVEQFEGMGAKAWSLKGTSLMTDKLGRLFRQVSGDQSAIAMVDKLTGKDRWSHKTESFATPYLDCSDDSRVFITSGGKVKALDPSNGQVRWTVDSQAEGGSLYCSEGYNSVFFIGYNQNNKFRSIEKEGGKERWSYTPDGFASYLTKQNQNVLLSVYKENITTIVNLESGTGRVKWTRALKEGEWATATTKGVLFVSRPNYFERLDNETGKKSWSYEGTDSYLEWNQSGVVYVRQARKVVRLNPADGKVLWSIEIPESVGDNNSSAVVLKNGDLLVRSNSTSSGQAKTKLINPDGTKLWETQDATGSVYPTEDSSGKLYYKGGRNLIAIDRSNGAILWNFSREFPIQSEVFFNFETYGDDVFVLYGGPASRYPPMGIVRLDAKSGAQQWDVWNNETTTLIGASDNLLFTNGVMGSSTSAYKR
ncbi:MAG: hypothetical protein EOP07_02245 [Proteobacteria bacterium]|nr:MAG: hypothetical protein EOP07_02245 [Pseudomonadota bacterium]